MKMMIQLYCNLMEMLLVQMTVMILLVMMIEMLILASETWE